MMRAAFEIKQSPTGNYYFTFKSREGSTLLVSCNFPDRAELEKSLSGVRSAAPLAEVCVGSEGKPPLFRIQPKNDGVVFSLIGFKGEMIFSSISYADEERCRNAIDALKAFSQKAAIEDLTLE